MPHPIAIGIIGDRNPENPTHVGMDRAFLHSAKHLGVDPRVAWVPTPDLVTAPERSLSAYSGILVSPGSPYRAPEGALNAIRWAREIEVPLLGTCGGFQHIILELARNVLGVSDAQHAEEHPEAAQLYVTPLACSLVGQSERVRLLGGSRAREVYGQEEVTEKFYCNFGLNPAHRAKIEGAGLRTSGLDKTGEVRVMELPGHRFFFGTLYVPQMSSTPERPHPLVSSLVRSAGQ